MTNYSEFNNNNYLPGFSTEMAASTFAPYSATALHLRGAPTSFTFTAPTQCSSIVAPLSTIQSSTVSAPGMGATWQHSVPTSMPWNLPGHASSPPRSRAPIFFTGLTQSYDSQSACCSPARRPKRKAFENMEDGPTSKVFLCTDQLANLQITSTDTLPLCSTQVSGHRACQDTGGAVDSQDKAGWGRFREVENRLDVEFEEVHREGEEAHQPSLPPSSSSSSSSPTHSPRGQVLKVKGSLLEEVAAQSILPRSVVEDINSRPCMQLVVWQCPGSIIRDVITSSSEDHQHHDKLQQQQQQRDSSQKSSTPSSSTNPPTSSDTPPELSDIRMEEVTSARGSGVMSRSLATPSCVSTGGRRVLSGVRTGASSTVQLGEDVFEGMDDDMQL